MITNICTIGTFRNVRNVGLVQSEATQKKMLLKSGIGGLTMATKRVCDRCGAEINPPNYVTYAGMRRVKNDINDNDYELCVSCAHELRKWFSAPRKDAEGAMIVHL